MHKKFELSMLEKTEDGQSIKLPVLEIGIRHLVKSYPGLFSMKRANCSVNDTYAPYTEQGRWFINVPVTESSIAMDVLQLCGDPRRIPFIF